MTLVGTAAANPVESLRRRKASGDVNLALIIMPGHILASRHSVNTLGMCYIAKTLSKDIPVIPLDRLYMYIRTYNRHLLLLCNSCQLGKPDLRFIPHMYILK